ELLRLGIPNARSEQFLRQLLSSETWTRQLEARLIRRNWINWRSTRSAFCQWMQCKRPIAIIQACRWVPRRWPMCYGRGFSGTIRPIRIGSIGPVCPVGWTRFDVALQLAAFDGLRFAVGTN